ncbi:MAG: GDSL-type esterase/lipase family protein [Pseudomonadota bacterium]
MKSKKISSLKTHLRQATNMLLTSIGVISTALLLESPAFAVTGTPQVAWTIAMPNAVSFTQSNFTCRYITRPSISGNGVRIQLSNFYGDNPLTLNSVTVALRVSGAAASGQTTVTFNGQPTVTIPPRSKIMSDPIDFNVTAQQDMAISIYYPGTTPVLTHNTTPRVNSYCSAANVGNATYDVNGTPFTSSGSISGTWVQTLDAVDVYQTQPYGAVVALGASVTQGWNSSIDQNKRWVDVLSTRLLNSANPKSVVNEGIAGSTACSAVGRVNGDGLALSNVSEIFLGGVGGNDIGNGATGSQVISCYQQIISQVRAAGLRILAGTLPPREGFNSTQEGYRVQLNNWIMTPGNFDGVVDFDALVRSSSDPTNWNSSYRSDGTHPNDAGSLVMGNAIPLSLFTSGGSYSANGVGTGTYDDMDYRAFSYAGSWTHDAACGVANCYKNTRSFSTTVNSNVTLKFWGTQIKLYAIKKSKMGIGAVSIDGGTETNIDLYSPTDVRQLVWTSPVLSNAPHTFKFRVTGTKNASSSDVMIEPDAVDVLGVGAGTFDDMNYSAFKYFGSGWTHDNTCSVAGPASPNCYNNSKSWSTTTNDNVTVTFVGSQIKLYGIKNVSFGMGGVSIDGGAETNINFYAPTRMGNQLMWTSPTLPSGMHTFKLRVTGILSGGSNFTVAPDAVVISP